MKKSVTYKGNTISFAEYGDSNGFPVLVQHGMIASIEDSHLFQPLIDAGVRLVCTARPGYGDSFPAKFQSISEWAAVTEALSTELALGSFDILAMSSGAPYGYAIASGLPGKTRNVFIFSGTPALYDEKVRSVWPYPLDADPSVEDMQKLARELFFSGVSEDADLPNDVQDSMRNDCFGPGLDMAIRARDWGFALSKVDAQVYMRHSHQDQIVPPESAKLTAQLIPNCELEIDEGQHFSPEDLARFIHDRMLKHYCRDPAAVPKTTD
jgi:pimeloyl-ACP methyl ester carboxylesterase